MKTRKEFVNFINEKKYKTAVEIGVGWGGFSEYLLTQCPNIHLTSIDPWYGVEHRPGSKEFTIERLKKFGERSTIIVEKSIDAASRFGDESLDFIYIDGDHSPNSIAQDIKSWWPKVKKNGILAGHDYSPLWRGVIEAVNELRDEQKLELHLTETEGAYSYEMNIEFGEEAQAPSWWLEKPS